MQSIFVRKSVREGAAAGSNFVDANVSRHVLETWVPQFKFFGLGLGLMAITMAFGMIALNLLKMGMVITGHIPAQMRSDMPAPLKVVRVFQLSTLMGVMILMLALIIGIVLGVSFQLIGIIPLPII